LETKEAPLEQSLGFFEEGIRLARGCQQKLEEAKKKVEVLMKETGEVRPFQEAQQPSPRRQETLGDPIS
jgi:exodeoxyribonuclease VII small subunit